MCFGSVSSCFKPQSREKNSQSFAWGESRELAAEIAKSIFTSCRILSQSAPFEGTFVGVTNR